ncbi:uncharacterized protein LOC100897275 [Galendromus occidentalis]|uniref:Uncharacterized protein LOC100897275 n=1 Tax=Galendromus occidentalis TaxID=34638 RepID=A0AAJ6W108_9ACAR|nr:uncharacterized protein LOC100897275 [Galendromus occidentalis]
MSVSSSNADKPSDSTSHLTDCDRIPERMPVTCSATDVSDSIAGPSTEPEETSKPISDPIPATDADPHAEATPEGVLVNLRDENQLDSDDDTDERPNHVLEQSRVSDPDKIIELELAARPRASSLDPDGDLGFCSTRDSSSDSGREKIAETSNDGSSPSITNVTQPCEERDQSLSFIGDDSLGMTSDGELPEIVARTPTQMSASGSELDAVLKGSPDSSISLEEPLLESRGHGDFSLAADSGISHQTTKYRSGRESNHSNGSIDGFCSPVLSEANTLTNAQMCPQLYEIDELARSLEKRWSLNDMMAELVIEDVPLRNVPKSGSKPEDIREFRIPPPMEHVEAVVSYASEKSLYVQLLLDEKDILALDGAIQSGGSSPPLKFFEVQPGDFVLCQYEVDDRFYRARLLRARGDDKFEVRFVDYGNRCVASVKNMRRLPENLRDLGRSAIKCDFSQNLRANAAALKQTLQEISEESYFLVCFDKKYRDRDPRSPIFTIIDAQRVDGSPLLQIPTQKSLGPVDSKLLVRNLELKAHGLASVDLMEDLDHMSTVVDRINDLPPLPCGKINARVGSLVVYEGQRAEIIWVMPGELVSLELIDDPRKKLENIRLENCRALPLAAIDIPPAAPRMVRVEKLESVEKLRGLCPLESGIEMIVVGAGVPPVVKFPCVE